jgi:hypothetical protein
MNVLSIFLLMAAVSLTTVSARFWQVGDNGLSRWDYNCHFVGNVIGAKPSLGEQCGGICIANSQCTHFTHAGGYCYLKRYTGNWREVGETANTCGFIPGRSAQNKRK